MFGARLVRHLLEQIFGWERVVSEGPIDVAPEDNPTSEPEPDVYVLRNPEFRGQPTPVDQVLVVEIADTTLAFDRTTKRSPLCPYWDSRILGAGFKWPTFDRAPRAWRQRIQIRDCV